jgi:hypothetical protein
MLNYSEHVFIVIHRVADGESGEMCGKCICPGTKYSLLGGLSKTFKSSGVKSRGEAILSFVSSQGMVAKGCHVMGGQSPIM